MCVPLPIGDSIPTRTVSVEEMEESYRTKQKEYRDAIIGGAGVEERCGFVNTIRGAVLTSDAVIALVKAKSAL